MITSNIENTTTESLNESVNTNNTARQYCRHINEAVSLASSSIGDLINSKTTNIVDYKIDILKEDEPQVFSKMKNSLPSVKDFLTLCIAKNQKLAADKLDMMLTNTSSTRVFNWQINLIKERGFSFVGKDEFDNLNKPLATAAKYGNIPVCKVIIKHIEKESAPLMLSVMSFLTSGNTSTAKKYNHELKRNESEICYQALCKALKYNNLETAEYIYSTFVKCTKKVYDRSFITEKLLYLVEDFSSVTGLDFLLEKLINLNIEDKNNYDIFKQQLCIRLMISLESQAKKNNWDLVKYVVTNYMELLTNGTENSQRIFLYETLKNKQLDIAKDFIKNIQVENIFNKIGRFQGISFFGDFTFLDILKKDLDSKTFDWLLMNIEENKACSLQE